MIRRFKIVDLPGWLALGWSFYTLIAINVFFMRPAACLNRWDEAYITAFAWRLLDGQMLPYVDAVSQRGPVLYWLAAIVVGLGERMSWMPVRICGAICVVLTVAFTFLAARRAGRVTAGGIAAIASVAGFLLAMAPADGLAFNGEHALNVFATGALLCTTAALDRSRARPSAWLAAGAGACAALGALCKQVGLGTLAPLGLWVAAAAASRPGLERRGRWALALSFGGGAIAPVAATALRYAAAGELGTLWYWLYTYNADVYMYPFPWKARLLEYRRFAGEHITLGGLAAAAIAWGASRPLVGARGVRDLARAYDEEGFVATVALSATAAIAASLSPMRFFYHYFVQIIPWLGLLFGLLLERSLEGRGRRRPLLSRIALLGACLLVVAFAWRQRFKDYRAEWKGLAEWRDGGAPPVCADIEARSKPGDTIFVWGFEPDLYVRCKRGAASRYLFTSMVAGFVPFIPQEHAIEESLVVPGSREALIADLERAKPPVIVDAPASMGNRSMMASALLARYVREHYCRWKTVDELSLFVRRGPGEPCPDIPNPYGLPLRRKPALSSPDRPLGPGM